MSFLVPVFKNEEISYYKLHHKEVPELELYCVSTPSTRKILNHPEVVGVEFTRALKKAVTSALKFLPVKESLARLAPETISVIHFLRSGLNFGIREALYDAWGFNTHFSSFITSQRARDQYGRWYIKDDQYRKIVIPAGANLFIGEIVATGVTVQNGLEIIYKQAKNLGRPIRNLFFFTIGCHKIEKALQKYDRLFRASFPGYEKTRLVYLEGKFHLADSKTDARLKIQGTDLMRHPALLAPEFELSQFQKLSFPLERCVIYDGGSRAFDPVSYFEDVRSYWEQLLELGQRGWTLREALKERWPSAEYNFPFPRFAEVKRKSWKKIDRGFLNKIHHSYQKRWKENYNRREGTSRALIDLCHRRLRQLPR
jgi:hypothetical protein